MRRDGRHCIGQEGHREIIEALIRHGADVNAIDEIGFTPLAMALGDDREAVVSLLFEAGADVDQRISSNGNGTVLHTACSWGYEEIAERLVEAGADLNARDDEGIKPLGFAVEGEFPAIVAFLRARGAVV